jgi:hypothetical protein
MIRAKLRLLRHFISAILLLALLLCGAEVGVRIYEVVQGRPVCSETTAECLIDPTHLAVPSWLANLELKPHAVVEVKNRDQKRKIEVRTNSLGLRGPELVVPKPPETYRIVVLGDETIFSPETSEQDHFTTELAALLHERTRLRIEVVNAGIPGACPLTEFLLFKQKLLAIQPDLVLLHYDWSDATDDRQLRRRTRSDSHGTPLSCAHASLHGSVRKPHPLDQVRQQFRLVDWGLVATGNQWKQQINQQAAISREAGTNAYAWLRDEHPESNVSVMQSFQPIGDVARLSQGTCFQMVVMTSPKPWQVSARCTSGQGIRMKAGVTSDACYPNRAPFEALEDFASELNVPYVDLSMPLMSGERPEANYLRYAPRWSPTGHRRVAEYLAGFLNERIPGPWNSRYFQQDDHISQEPAHRNEVQWASGTR